MVRPKGFEPLAFCSGGRRSIQLSYGRSEFGILSEILPQPDHDAALSQGPRFPARLDPPERGPP